MALLSLRNVTRRFGGIVALDGVSFDVPEGQIVGLIGPNGAGKTTAFNVITRLYTPNEGEVEFAGESLLKTPVHKIIGRGIARTFQNVELFRTMTVLENVLVGAHTRRGDVAAEARDALDYVGLAQVASRPVAGLPFGTLKRVELARALVSEPKLLLLDEPAGGLNHEEVEELGRFIRKTRDDRKLTVLLVEHHMNLVMGISDHVHVLNFGRVIAEGPPAEVRANPAVIEAYLGTDERDPAKALDAPPETDMVETTTRHRQSRRRSRMALLELTDVEARYGPVRALHGVSLAVDEGQIVAVLGANGAGKTTTLRAISGTVKRTGEIALRRPLARPPRPGGGREAGRRARPRRPRHVRRAVGGREPASRRVHAARLARRRHQADERLLPLDRRAARAARRHALRRRAADARARPRADGPPAAAAARRAVARAGAARHA